MIFRMKKMKHHWENVIAVEHMVVVDFQKKILGPGGPYVFIFGRQNKDSSRQKL